MKPIRRKSFSCPLVCALALAGLGSASLGRAAEPALHVGTQLSYQGSIESRKDDGDAGSRKSFELSLWVAKANADAVEVYWLVEERGRGAWPWPERFGRVSIDRQGRASGAGPALLYERGGGERGDGERDDGHTIVPLAIPLWTAEKPLSAGAAWQDDKLEFRVEQAAQRNDRDTWQIAARDGNGLKTTLWVDQHNPLVVARAERVMMGRGEEYQLKYELVGREKLKDAAFASLARAMDSLAALGGKLNRPPRSQDADWTPEQLAVLQEQFPEVQKLAAGTPLEKLVRSAARDLHLQSDRIDAVAELRKKIEGSAAEPFSAKGVGGEELSEDKLRGQVTVLHFWEYRDEPLKEPYGQVGYLDFLYHRRQAAGLQVYGVAVDGRLADDKTRGAAERSVKRLREFMHLSYPVLLDGGALVKQFGDPRVAGASLPLFVVIGRDGKIVHYHVGHYEVHQDQGLKELDEAVAAALEKGVGAGDGKCRMTNVESMTNDE